MRLSAIVICIFLLSAGHSHAQIYKWTDEYDVTHYSDCPPTDCVYEEVDIPQGPSQEAVDAAKERALQVLEARRLREAEEKLLRERATLEALEQDRLAAERLSNCAAAIYQIELLSQKRRVFKQLADGERRYIENEARDTEISRITDLKNRFCSSDPSEQAEELLLAQKMGLALSRRCYAARETLDRLQQPGANPGQEKLANYQMYVDAFCPLIEIDDLWLGDWIIVRKDR